MMIVVALVFAFYRKHLAIQMHLDLVRLEVVDIHVNFELLLVVDDLEEGIRG